jgi:hypothetical protein
MTPPETPARLLALHRYTITSEGASRGYFRLVEDPSGAWVTWAEVEALLRDAAPIEHHESRSPDGGTPSNATHQPDMPRWKCRQCGCLWRDNLDGSVSLFDANQTSCQNCEMLPTAESCVIEWFKSHAEPQALYNLLSQAKDALAAVIADCDGAGPEPADSHSMRLRDAAPQEPDEEMVPHPFNLRTEPAKVGEEVRESIWCKDCEYHRDHAIHGVAAQTAGAEEPAESMEQSAARVLDDIGEAHDPMFLSGVRIAVHALTDRRRHLAARTLPDGTSEK